MFRISLGLLVANLTKAKWCKKSWNMTETLAYSESILRGWIPTWQGLDGFQKSLHLCALDESSLSIGRVKMCFLGKLWGSLMQIVYMASHISGKCYLLYFINGKFVISFHLISNKTLHISPFLFIYWHVINILWCQLYQFINSIWHFFCNFKLLKGFSFFSRIFSQSHHLML